MAVVNEAITAIRAIKLNTWEESFEARIAARRAREVETLRAFLWLRAVTSTLWLAAPTMAAASSFLIRTQLLGLPLSAAQGFTALTLFQLLSVSLTFLPTVISQAVMAKVFVCLPLSKLTTANSVARLLVRLKTPLSWAGRHRSNLRLFGAA